MLNMQPQRCFKAAVNAGFSGLQILNHIDSQDGSQWRNLLNVDPTAKYGGWSYEDIVVRPASEALKAVIKPNTKVRMTQGCELRTGGVIVQIVHRRWIVRRGCH